MINIENLSNNLQESFENLGYLATAGGFLGDITYFTIRNKDNTTHDIIISDEIIDFIPCEENQTTLEAFNLSEVKNLVSNYLNKQNVKINNCGIFVEEYQLQQVICYYFNISESESSNIIQIQIFPGDFAVLLLFGEEPTIPDISKTEFIGDFEGCDLKELLDQGLEIPEVEFNLQIPLKKSKKVGRNEPCPCGSGIKYKKCCGKIKITNLNN